MQNRLLARLPGEEYRKIVSSMEKIQLRHGFVIVKADRPIDYVYFLTSGIGSVITVSAGKHQAEAGMFGREGFSPTSAGVGGTISVHEVLMQVEGDGRAAFRSATQMMTETVSVKGDLLCEQSENAFGQADCGPLYRHASEGTAFAYVNSSKVFYFSAVE